MKKNNDLCTILHVTSSLKIGGAEAVLHNLVVKMSTFNHYILYINEGPHVAQLQEKGVNLKQLRGVCFKYDPTILFVLMYHVYVIKPDCIHTLLWLGNLLGRIVSRIMKVPCVSVFHNNIDQDGRVRTIIDHITLRMSKKLVAVSQQVAQSVYTQHPWLSQKRSIAIITNGIDLIVPASLDKSALNANENDLIIGSVGRLMAVKNYGLLLRSFALTLIQFNNSRLVIIGDGPERDNLLWLSNQLGIAHRVTWIGQQPAQQYYHLFDCFVLSSFKEGISLALLEAMSTGRACIVTNNTMQHSVLTNDYDGIVVDDYTSPGLAQALVMILACKDVRMRLGLNAQKTVARRFNAQLMVHHYEELFRKECASNRYN